MDESLESRGSVLPISLDIEKLVLEAQNRWLSPAETCEILRNYKIWRIAPEPPNEPPSGSLFLFDRKKVRNYRKDGHNWGRETNGKIVKEAHKKLQVGGIDALHCYYAHGEEKNFQRRCYSMVEEDFSHIVLVHYLKVMKVQRSILTEGSKKRSSSGANGETGCSLDDHVSSSNLDNQDAAVEGPKVIEKISEISATPLGLGNASDAQSQKDSLATICDATDAASDIRQVFQGQSFQKNRKTVLWVDLGDDKESKRKARETVYDFRGIDSVSINTERKQLTITGEADPAKMVKKLRRYWPTDIISVEPAKDEEKLEWINCAFLIPQFKPYIPQYTDSYAGWRDEIQMPVDSAQTRERMQLQMLVLFVFTFVFVLVISSVMYKKTKQNKKKTCGGPGSPLSIGG